MKLFETIQNSGIQFRYDLQQTMRILQLQFLQLPYIKEAQDIENMNIPYPAVCGLIFLILGGTSSAIWGIIVSKKSGRISSYIDILKDYFGLDQPSDDTHL